MTVIDLIQNFGIGIVGGVITLAGDRWLQRVRINRRLRPIAGEYAIVSIAPERDTKSERVTIEHVGGVRFAITASGGPTGNWTGEFGVREDFFDVAHGVYRYPGSTDWGQHELFFDSANDSIFVFGINRSKPGLMEPFSYSLVRKASKLIRHT